MVEPTRNRDRLDEAYLLLAHNMAVLAALNAVKATDQMPRATWNRFDVALDFAIFQILDTIQTIHRMEDGTDLPF
jgi:hypothetical protein